MRRRGRYGIDAPYVPGLLAVLGLGVIAAGTVALATGGPYSGWTIAWLVWDLVFGLLMVASAAVYLHTTLRGKFVVWSELLGGLQRQRLGWRFWYGGPWAGTTLVTGTKPGVSAGGCRSGEQQRRDGDGV